MPDPSRSALTTQQMKVLWRSLDDYSRDYRFLASTDYDAVRRVMNMIAARIREVEDHQEQQSATYMA